MNVLRIRAEGLRANLAKIKDHLNTVPDRGLDLNKLEDRLTKVAETLNKARRTVAHAKTDTDDSLPDVAKNLAETEQQIRETVIELQAAKGDIASLRQKSFRIQQFEVHKNIAKYLNERTSPCLQSLRDMEDGLKQQGAIPQQHWQSFGNIANDSCQAIFTEYIEFLGGLALRDTGFDAGISRIGEELINTFSTNNNADPMLAIPTRQQAVALTLARIIRITFPDWTIWALPSTAYEFWQVVARKEMDGALRSQLRLLTGNGADAVEARFDQCLGDAFATYTMGPAYAFFAVFLRLNPVAPFTGRANEAADEIRAYAILQMLECMDLAEPGVEPYSKVRKQVSAAWDEAIAQTGAQPTGEETQQLAADKIRIGKLVQALFTTLQEGGSVPFTLATWNEIQSWVDPLLKNGVDQMQMPNGAELRHVLNAAWLARVRPDRDPKTDITAAANKLANKIPRPDRK